MYYTVELALKYLIQKSLGERLELVELVNANSSRGISDGYT